MRFPTFTVLRSRVRPASVALLLLPLGACSNLPARDGPAPPHEVDITSTDFSFRMPDTIPAGLTRIRLTNEGREYHHAQLARLHAGRSVAELRDTLAAGRDLPSWVTFVGGPGVPSPKTPGEVLISLEPGTYAVLCFVSSGDKVPHLAKGMMRELTVLPAAGPRQSEPRADARIVLDDYAFALTPALSAGRRTIRVENAGPQPHEVEFIRLEPGKTAADVLAWLRTHEGPPPGEAFGGTAALQTGQVNYVSAEFTPGEYAMVCFVPDAADGRPHTAHGMVREFRVN